MGSGAVIGLCSVLLVAMVVAVAVGVSKHGGSDDKVSTSSKAVNSVCQETDYKEACVNSLSKEQGNDPKAIVKAEFQAAMEDIRNAIRNSDPIRQAEKDDKTKKAVEKCKEFLDISIDDLQRSFNKLGDFDMSKLNDLLSDLEIWLSGSLTFQTTCLDGFENTTGDTGEKMKKLLTGSSELTTNVLAMIQNLDKVLGNLKIPGFSRKLLSTSDDGVPSWVDAGRRSLLQANPTPDAVVAQDGSGQFKTINEAVKTAPMKSTKPFIILIKPGLYKEYVDIPRHMNGITLIGSGIDNTRITGDKCFAKGVATFDTATFSLKGDYFTAKDITFENTAGPAGHQAVALRVSGNRAVFYNCQMHGYQDTLYAHSYSQYYRDCTISGTIDFIFGDASAVFQNCKMVVRKPDDNQQCMVTAQGRKEERQITGTVIQNCVITGDTDLMAANPPVRSYLGRPWKEFSRTIIMNSYIDKIIEPEGWSPWAGTFALDTLYYAEFENKGPGADTSKRVAWKGIKKITAEEAGTYTGGRFLQGDDFVKNTGFPYEAGMMAAP